MNGVEIRAQIDTETVRALLLANGGGVVAFLALLPVILDRPGQQKLAVAILIGVIAFTFGLAFAIIHNQFRRRCSLVYSQHVMRPPTGHLLGLRFGMPTVCFFSWMFMWLSLATFAFAGTAVGWVGFFSLGAGALCDSPPALQAENPRASPKSVI
jgi:hypothetical protein